MTVASSYFYNSTSQIYYCLSEWNLAYLTSLIWDDKLISNSGMHFMPCTWTSGKCGHLSTVWWGAICTRQQPHRDPVLNLDLNDNVVIFSNNVVRVGEFMVMFIFHGREFLLRHVHCYDTTTLRLHHICLTAYLTGII